MDQLANEIYEYIAQQEQSVSVGEIAGHLAKKTDRRTLNQLLLDMAWQGDLKKTLKDGKAYYTAPEARHAKILSQLDAEITRLENMAKDLGYDLHPSNIGDTGFDMYRWTFTKGTRKSGEGWSVAIPDGFSVIASTSGRAFEAVPQGTETEDLGIQKVQLLPGVEQEFKAIQGKKWSYHLQARKGQVESYATTLAQIQLKLMGAMIDTPLDCFSVVTDQVSAVVLVLDTDGGSFSYQIQMLTEGKSQALRVQTSFMTEEQKSNLTQSVTEWVKTFRFDKPNPAILKKAPLSNPQIPTQLRNGSTALFDQAADLAIGEAKVALSGQLALQKYRVEQGILQENGAEGIQKAVDSGMEVVSYYVQAADALVAKLEQGKFPAKTMNHVYTKLQELNMEMNGLSVNGVAINGSTPDGVKCICAKWEQAMAKLQKTAPPKPAYSNVQKSQPPAKSGKDSKSTSDSSVQDYVSRSERKLKNFRHDWEIFTEDVPDTLRELVTQGMRPSFSSRNSGNQIGMSISFESDTSEAKKYIEKVRDRMDDALMEIQSEIQDIDRDMEQFQRNGLDSRQLAKLVENLNNWIDYIPEMRFAITDEKAVNFRIPPEVSEIKQKWKRIARDAPQRSTVDVPQTPPHSSTSSAIDALKEREAAREKAQRDQETREQQLDDAIKNAEIAIYEREMKAYRTELTQFEQGERKAKQEQDAHFQRLCSNARGNRLAEAVKKRDKIIVRAESEIERQRKCADQEELTLSQLKCWNFKEKFQHQKMLAEAKRIIVEKQDEISRAKQTCQDECSKVESFVKANESRFLETAKTAHPIPAKPVEPQKPISDSTGNMSHASLQNTRLARILLDRMKYGVEYTAVDLVELIRDLCPNCATSKIFAIMRRIPEDRIKVKKNEEGKNVYSLT